MRRSTTKPRPSPTLTTEFGFGRCVVSSCVPVLLISLGSFRFDLSFHHCKRRAGWRSSQERATYSSELNSLAISISAACQFSTTVIGGRGTALEVDGAAIQESFAVRRSVPKYTPGGT